MTTYTWPNTPQFVPASAELRVIDTLQRVHESTLSGYVQTQSMPGARWGWAFDMAPQGSAERQALEAYLLRLSGRQHRVQLWDHKQPRPRGSIALTGVTLGASAAQFAESLVLAGCRSPDNLLSIGGMEIDTNGDGLADGWVSYSSGTLSGLAYSRAGGPDAFVQRVLASSMGGTLASSAGIALADRVPVIAGQLYTISADILGFNGTQRIEAAFYDSGGSSLASGGSTDWIGAGLGYDRRSISVTSPAGAATMQLWIYMHSGTGASPEIRIDRVQVAAGTTTAWGVATLLAGDWLGLAGGQLVRVVEDAAATAGGAMTVAVRHMLRSAATSGSAVTLDRPTALYVRTESGLAMPRMPGLAEPGLSLDFVEVFA